MIVDSLNTLAEFYKSHINCLQTTFNSGISMMIKQSKASIICAYMPKHTYIDMIVRLTHNSPDYVT